MDSAPAGTRAIVTGLLLAVLSAGSLVAFSLVARPAHDPAITPVVPHHPTALAAPVVVDIRDRERGGIAGIRVEPATLGEGAAPIVLGSRVRNDERDRTEERHDGKDRGAALEVPLHAPDRDRSSEWERSVADHHSNGNAYGHYKDKARGNAYGHSGTPHSKGPKKKK